ncbi:COG1470 family protein [Streptomyces sp. NPDC002306]
MSYAARVLPLSLLLLGAAPSAAASSPAADWSAAPSGGGRPAFYGEGTPGTVLQDTVSVTNRGGRPVTVRLRGTGVPVAFATTAVRVPARTRADVPFAVTVPADAPPGERSGTIVVRDGDDRTATVALRLRVGGPELAALTVEHVAVRGDRITYELVNRGTTVLAPRLAVRADGVFGRRLLDRAPRSLPVALPPGRRLELSEPWPGRPAFDAVTVRLTVTAAGGARGTASGSARFVPWGAVAGTGAAGTAAAALLAVRRRGRRTAGRAVVRKPRTEGGPTGAAR